MKYSIRNMREFAIERGGKCLSKEYIDPYVPLKWMCANGHTWDGGYYLVSRGYWCVQCSKEEEKQQRLEILRRYAQKKGGLCLSATYTNVDKKYKWKCHRLHIWEQNFGNLKKQGWCRQCRKEKAQQQALKKLKAFAVKKGGKCLSDLYTGSHDKLKWQCKNGHVFRAQPFHIKRGDSWCAVCTKKAMHTIEEMQRIAESHGGKCISTVYINNKTKLKWQCSKGHKWQAMPLKICIGQWCPVCSYDRVSEKLRGDISDIRKMVEGKGGKLISKEFINMLAPLKFQCGKGHTWITTASSIKSRNTWCPYCAHRVKLTIKEMQDIAVKHGGKCLSSRYVNSNTKLNWKCSKGHQWMATPAYIKRGKWCLICARSNRSSKLKIPLRTKASIAKK